MKTGNPQRSPQASNDRSLSFVTIECHRGEGPFIDGEILETQISVEASANGSMLKERNNTLKYCAQRPRTFIVPEGLLSEKSDYFRAALSRNFSEAKTKHFIFDDTRPGTFSLLVYWVFGQTEFPIRGYSLPEFYLELFILAERFLMPNLQDDILSYLHGLLLPETPHPYGMDEMDEAGEQDEQWLAQRNSPFPDGDDLVDFLQLVWSVTPDSSRLRVFFANTLAHFYEPGSGSIMGEEMLTKLPRSCLLATINSIAGLRLDLKLRMDDWEDPVFLFCSRYIHESTRIAVILECAWTSPAEKLQQLVDSAEFDRVPISDPAGLRSFSTRVIASIYEDDPGAAVNEDLLKKLPKKCLVAVLLAMIELRQDVEFCGEEWAENALEKFFNNPRSQDALGKAAASER